MKKSTEQLSDLGFNSIEIKIGSVKVQEKKYFSEMEFVPVNFLPARLVEGKEWYVVYYAYHPEKKKLHRKKVKLMRIHDIKERKKYAKGLIFRLNNALASGWNPFESNNSANDSMTLT